MNRRLLLLLVLVVLAAALVDLGVSRALYTTSSTTKITATADGASNWLHLYSQSTDPAKLGTYATQRVQTGTGALCATGADTSLALAMGGVHNNGTSYTFNRSFTIQTPATFPVTSVTHATIVASYVVDPTTNMQPIRDCRFSTTSGTGGSASVTLAANTKYQANIRMRASGTGWVVGQTYHPTLCLTVTFTGSPASYYVYNIPLSVTITNW